MVVEGRRQKRTRRRAKSVGGKEMEAWGFEHPSRCLLERKGKDLVPHTHTHSTLVTLIHSQFPERTMFFHTSVAVLMLFTLLEFIHSFIRFY